MAPGCRTGSLVRLCRFVVRVMTLANELEVHHRLGGPDAAVAMARKRAGSAFDPAIVEVFCTDPAGILAVVGRPSLVGAPAGCRT
jgi:hypothetical protein